jgi:hypothetical protein
MKTDTLRFIASAAVVLCVIAIIILAAAGCRDFGAYVAAGLILGMAAFVGSTSDA